LVAIIHITKYILACSHLDSDDVGARVAFK